MWVVAAGILPAVEPGILPGGIDVWFAEGNSMSHLWSGRQDGRRYGLKPTLDTWKPEA